MINIPEQYVDFNGGPRARHWPTFLGWGGVQDSTARSGLRLTPDAPDA